MRILCVFGQHNYGDAARGEGVEYTHFLPALRALGHETFFFESFARGGYDDFAALNRSLLKCVEEVRPDVVFTVLMMAEVWLESVRLIRRAGCKVLNWSTDDSWKYREFSRLIASDLDLYATTCPDALAWYMRDGITNVHLTQWAASSAWLTAPKPAGQCRYPVSFIGSAYGNRPKRIAALRAAGITVECFGHGWPNGPVAAPLIPQIVRDSVVSLNFSEAGQGAGRQIKSRVFEVPASGGMLLTEASPGLGDYFVPDVEVLQFSNDAELISKTRQLLNDASWRDSMACAGHARAGRQHTYETRLRNLLEQLAGLAPVAPGQTSIDWVEFERVARRHPPGLGLKLTRILLIALCVLLWGRSRGPRAARRILFELCWRFMGRRTYTASGWPGRLFFRES